MRHYQSYVILNIFFLIVPTNGTWILFKRKENVNGLTCQGDYSVFSKRHLYSTSVCLLECVNHSGCKSVYHALNSGNCIGCTASFDISIQPEGLDESFAYYIQQRCPGSWNSFANSCYIIPEQKMSFWTGMMCQSLNAHPVIVDNEEENSYLKAFIKSKYLYHGDVAFFTGFTDIDIEGIWVEHGSNNEMIFRDWARDEPGGGLLENCLAFYFATDLRWVDITCTEELRIICEMDVLV